MNVSLNVHNIIKIANTVAAGTDTPAMPIHLLYGCCAVSGCLANKYLVDIGINLDTISVVKMVHKPDMTIPAVIVEADKVSAEFGNNAVVSEALLFILCTECLQTVEVLEAFGTGICKKLAKAILLGAGINPSNLNELSTKNVGTTLDKEPGGVFTPFGFMNGANGAGANNLRKPSSPSATPSGQAGSVLPPDILRLGCDMTAKAKAGKIDNIIGRDEETQRVIEVLCRKTKNNPVLIGEAGVGKSAIIEGLAIRIAEGRVPALLEGKTIFALDMGSLMAGTKYRGELEQRIEHLVQLITQRGDIILFIDEIHQITTGTGKEGELGISEMLKPKLARGEMQTIGATTTEEYRKFIEKDAALERRFGPILVAPPTAEQCIEILNGLKSSYERFHSVDIGADAIVAAVSLTDRYITERNLPDKAIDALDEACSKAKIKAQIDAASAERVSRDKGDAPAKEVAEKRPIITAESIAEVISIQTKIPVTKLTGDDRKNLINLEDELKKFIIGQDKAISYISKAVRRSRAGVGDPNRPIGSFMFLGRTGVGKTEVCKVLSRQLFNSDTALIKLDMSEFSESHSVSKLIGSPPGYVGYDDASVVCERVRRNPYCIVLFDEIEKAHGDIYNILLQILDEGRLTDNKGKTTSFRNAMIVMTSNVGVDHLGRTSKIGFSGGEEDIQSQEDEVMMQGLKKRFKPEFINRIDNIVVFNSLSKEDVTKITKIQIDSLSKKLQSSVGIQLSVSAAAIKHLVEKGYNSEYGARPLRRVIQTEIEDRIAEELLTTTTGTSVMVDVADGSLSFKFK